MNKGKIADELDRLAKINGGKLTPEMVVDEARPEGSPLHSSFEWDDTKAGENWRLQQARQLISKVVITVGDQEVHAFQNAIIVLNDEPIQAYFTAERVSSDENLRHHVLAALLADIRGLQARCAEVEGLENLFNQEVLEKFEESVAS